MTNGVVIGMVVYYGRNSRHSETVIQAVTIITITYEYGPHGIAVDRIERYNLIWFYGKSGSVMDSLGILFEMCEP